MKESITTKLDKLLEIVEILASTGDPRRIAIFLSNKHPEDVARVLERLPKDLRVQVFRHLPIEIQADSIIYVNEDVLEEMIKDLSNRDISELVTEMDADDATDFLAELDEEERERVLSLVDEDERREYEEMLQYEETSAGGLMTKEFLVFPGDTPVSEVLDAIKRSDVDVVQVFVVDEEDRFLGVVALRDLLDADPQRPIRDLVKEIPTVPFDMDQEDVIRVFEKYDLLFVPVVDHANRLLGIITVDDILDVLEEETSEDIARLAGLGEIQSLILPPWNAAKNRLPWLLANLLTAFIASAVVGAFKNTIDSFAYLAVFMPIIAGMGGNGGIQSLALTVRALSLGMISKRDATRIIVKEFLTGLLVGMVVGAITGLVAWFWVGKPLFGLIVFFALTLNMIVACVVGFIIPNIIAFFGGDPALASGVIVTTFTDVTGYFVFLGLATLLLKQLL